MVLRGLGYGLIVVCIKFETLVLWTLFGLVLWDLSQGSIFKGKLLLLYVCQSLLKGDSMSETIFTLLVSNSHRERYLGGESRRKLHKANDMIWKRIILKELVNLTLSWLGEVGCDYNLND